MKKDDYLTQTILAPEKQRTRIHQFDARTQQEAFAVSLEGLKSVCFASPPPCLASFLVMLCSGTSLL